MTMNGNRQMALRNAWNKQKQEAAKIQQEMDRKVKFANQVLQLMEMSEDWNGELLDRISESAFSLSLATADECGFFRVTR
jgi:hypothetical protein